MHHLGQNLPLQSPLIQGFDRTPASHETKQATVLPITAFNHLLSLSRRTSMTGVFAAVVLRLTVLGIRYAHAQRASRIAEESTDRIRDLEDF